MSADATRVGIDVGGTFTDLAVLRDGRLHVAKVASTRDHSAFEEALRRASAIGEPEEVLHGTTVATNAVLERRGPRLGFVATEGFRHLLHLARQDRPSLYDPRVRRPAPLASVEDCVGAPERIGPDGSVVAPLDEDALRAALVPLRGRVGAVAVTLLHAYANDTHETRVAEIVREELDVDVSASSEVLPEFREYERATTTSLNAFVRPAVRSYLGGVRAAAAGRPVGVMWSGGGIRAVEDSIRLPVHLLLSGPAAGVLGAAWAAGAAGFRDVVTLDMGGTSTDVAIVEDGVVAFAEEASLDGLPFRTPCVDVVSVGAGGGSIAWLDDGGALRVGPRSAGADPGPACYGRGGTEPTVTDAHVVLGHLHEGLAGGELQLAAGDAELAVRGLAGAARLSLEEMASGILRVVRATMARAVRGVTVERGKDVRRFALVAFGGAGPLHAVALARELGIDAVVVPRHPGALAAFGLLVARRRAERSRTRPTLADRSNDESLHALLADLAEEALGELAREGLGRDTCDSESFADCRYAGQSHELRVRVGEGFASLRGDFDHAHRARYGFARPDAPVEAVTFRSVALGPRPDVALSAPAHAGTPAPVARWSIEGSSVPVFDRDSLPAGWRSGGPLVVTELDSTTLVDEGSAAEVHGSGALVIRP